MPRHRITSSSLLSSQSASPSRYRGLEQDPTIWSRMDRAQVLGTPSEGHRGCVNALSWSDDGSTLLSGSDDKRICIWASDPETTGSLSPHPMKLVETISTGHRANIFSARYLPNTSSPTIISCAGDGDVRVYDVEHLSRQVSEFASTRPELDGVRGPGVLKCHTDRTKRIATENSPHLFLTVSEDGTVRQHDLRRPHTCRTQCPEPLFTAPRGVDLYSLSVSTVTPYMFAVAGRTDVAYVCDRRMTERQTPSWGNRTREVGQVNCVRRLGLSNEEWESMGLTEQGVFSRERHITCVKMSPEHADEVICSFAQHSTSLFSLYDSPPSTSMRSGSFSSVSSDHAVKAPPTSSIASPPSGSQYSPEDFMRSPPVLGKRRPSQLSSIQSSGTMLSRPRIEEENEDIEDVEDVEDVENEETGRTVSAESLRDEQDEESSGAGDTVTTGETILEDSRVSPTSMNDNPDVLNDGQSEVEDGNVRLTRRDIEELAHEMLQSAGHMPDEPVDFDLDEEGMLDEFYDDDEEEDDEDWDMDVDDDFEDEDDMVTRTMNRSGLPESAFSNVEMLSPRRSFKGAKNAETVKDCNFLGTRADKVCSGSDDGNFFVWDKDTGRLDGIWEADGHVVNVMEQHPTLPMVAVSGIDDTVKIFSPLTRRPLHSFSRLHLKDTIIKANTDRTSIHELPNLNILQFLASRGIQARFLNQEEEDDEEGGPQCRTQ